MVADLETVESQPRSTLLPEQAVAVTYCTLDLALQWIPLSSFAADLCF